MKDNRQSSIWGILWKSLWLVARFKNARYKELSKSEWHRYQIRGGMFLLGFLASIIWGLGAYEHYGSTRNILFPNYEQLKMDEGTLTLIQVNRSTDFLLLETSNHKKIWFQDIYGTTEYKNQLLGGLPVKVWSFTLDNVNYARIAQLDIGGKRVLEYNQEKKSYENDKKNYQKMFFYSVSLALFPLLAWMWEFIIQYKLKKEEN